MWLAREMAMPGREKLSIQVKSCPLVSTVVLELKHAQEFGFNKSYHYTQP